MSNPWTNTSSSVWRVATLSVAKSPSHTAKMLCLHWICSEKENLLKKALDLKIHFLRRGYNEQRLETDNQRVLNIPMAACLQLKRDQKGSACAPLGGHVRSHSSICPNGHQATSINPSCFGMTTEDLPVTATCGPLTPKEFEGSLGQGKFSTSPM